MYSKMTVTRPTGIVPGGTYDSSIANKYYGFFALEDVYVAGVCWDDLSTEEKVVFQKYRANYAFNQTNIKGLLLANNATTQTMLTANNTPTDALVPVLRNTQFSVVPLDQLIETGFVVLAGDNTKPVAKGDMLYKKVPTANDTPLDLITSYSFRQGATVDYTTYIPLGVEVIQTNLPLNTDVYGARILCIGQSPNIVQPTPAPAIAQMQPNSKQNEEIERLQAQFKLHEEITQKQIQELQNELKQAKAVVESPVQKPVEVSDIPTEKTDNKPKGSNK